MKTPTRILSRSEDNLVSSLLVPIQNKSLIVPNVVLAEVVPFSGITAVESAPRWCIGSLAWRGEQLPVISFEIANSQVHAKNSDSVRIAVLNVVGSESKYKFYAILVQGIPRMIKLTEAEVREDKQSVTGQAEKMAVITQLGKAVIPDLDYVESLLAKL